MNPLDAKLILDALDKLFAEQNARWDRRFADLDAAWDRRLAPRSGARTAGEQRDAAVALGVGTPEQNSAAQSVIADNGGGLFEPHDHDTTEHIYCNERPSAAQYDAPHPAPIPEERVLDLSASDTPFGSVFSGTAGEAASTVQWIDDALNVPASHPIESGSEVFGYDTVTPHLSSASIVASVSPARMLLQSASAGFCIDAAPSNTADYVLTKCSMYCRSGFTSMLTTALSSSTPTWVSAVVVNSFDKRPWPQPSQAQPSFNLVDEGSASWCSTCLWKHGWPPPAHRDHRSVPVVIVRSWKGKMMLTVWNFLAMTEEATQWQCDGLCPVALFEGSELENIGKEFNCRILLGLAAATTTVRPKSYSVVSRLQQPWFQSPLLLIWHWKPPWLSSVQRLISGAAKLQPMPWLRSVRQAISCWTGLHIIYFCLPPAQIINMGCSQPKLKSDLMIVTSMDSITPALWPMSFIPLIQEHTQQRHGGVCRTSLLQRFDPGNTEHGRQLIQGPRFWQADIAKLQFCVISSAVLWFPLPSSLQQKYGVWLSAFRVQAFQLQSLVVDRCGIGEDDSIIYGKKSTGAHEGQCLDVPAGGSSLLYIKKSGKQDEKSELKFLNLYGQYGA
ncbi:unnamed protein product [Miscanthus lutarioriparius]|uniref:Uncharacterized protein n=1 Tax=Miscanthus lutarioriparius TaxID=422564 RepID=A0A811MKD0_9POAL|nr:unnamed protein product [Miscanthus lutarioriparius]